MGIRDRPIFLPAFLVRMPVVMVARRTPFFFAGFAAPLGSFFGTFLAAGFLTAGFLAAVFFGAVFFFTAFFRTAAAFLAFAGAFFLAIYFTDLSCLIFPIAEQHSCQNAFEKVICVDRVSAVPVA